MRKINYVLILGPLLTCCTGNPGQTPEEKIDFVVTRAYEKGGFIGSVLVANQGEILYRKNFGMSNAVSQTPISDSTRFLIASLSKPITAILILQLMEQGKIEPDDTLSKFFNVGGNTQASEVSVHQLLTHTSGIREIISPDHAFQEADLRQAEFHFEPGSDFEYSNTGYVILKEIAERSSEKDFEELVTKIFESAHMSASGVAKDPHQVNNLAVGYREANQSESVEIGHSLEIIDGAGSLYATANDLFLLDRALYSETLLSKKSRDLMQIQHVKEKFGYGWFLRERSGTWDVMYHKGDLPGYTSFMSRRTKRDEVIILLSNSGGCDLAELENDISRILKFDN